MVQVKDLLRWIDSWAPFRYAEPWDNCGLQIGDPDSEIERVLIALDPATSVIKEAVELGCQCLVTHHPLLIKPISSVRTDSWPGSAIKAAVVSGINIIAAHTNLDAASQGTNAQLKKILEIDEIRPLESQAAFGDDERYLGIGFVGLLSRETTLKSLAERIGGALGQTTVRVTGDVQKELTKAAVCSGSGGSLMRKAFESGAEVFITGDIKYHDAKFAEECGLAVIDIGHFGSEKIVVGPVAEFLRSRAASETVKLEVFVSRFEADPFRWIPCG